MRCIGEIVSWWAAQRAANVSRRSLTISQINISHQLTATSLPTVPEKVCPSVHPSSVCISCCLVLPHLLAHRQVLANMAYEYVTVVVFSERELTFTFAICCRPSVCRLSVTLVHSTHAVVIFGNISTALGTLAIRWHPLKISRRLSQRNPSAEELNTGGVAK